MRVKGGQRSPLLSLFSTPEAKTVRRKLQSGVRCAVSRSAGREGGERAQLQERGGGGEPRKQPY